MSKRGPVVTVGPVGFAWGSVKKTGAIAPAFIIVKYCLPILALKLPELEKAYITTECNFEIIMGI